MNSLLSAVKKYNMLSRGDAVLCALSGGADSVCMTHALARARENLGITLAAAHFSHGIRPNAAAFEREIAQKLCDSCGIELFCGEGDTPLYARERGIGLEQAARELRYRFLRQTLENWNARGKIATAHNLGDQAETVLFNLIRGAGLAGLKGIAPVRGELIRPLIGATREQIESYLACHALDFARDESNGDVAYSRNRLRLEAMPVLRKINPRCAENIAQAGFLALEALDFIDSQADALYEVTPNGVLLDSQELARAHPALAARAVLRAFERASRGAGLNRAHIDETLALARSKNPSASLDLPGGMRARREYSRLIIGRAPQATAPESASVGIGESVIWGDWRVSVSREPAPNARVYGDLSVELPLTVRARRTGDAILTRAGTKTVKKLMIDMKIPKNVRDITPVLCDNIGVLCAAGLAWGERSARGESIYISVERVKNGNDAGY